MDDAALQALEARIEAKQVSADAAVQTLLAEVRRLQGELHHAREALRLREALIGIWRTTLDEVDARPSPHAWQSDLDVRLGR